jgi:hypothetical protein
MPLQAGPGGTFLCRVHNPRAAQKEPLQRCRSDDGRKGSSSADGFVLVKTLKAEAVYLMD